MLSDSPKLSVDELYARAMELPEHQRNAYVIANCADAHARPELLLRLAGAMHTLVQNESPGTNLAPAISIGARLGRYRIQSALGAGGMGYVYEALDETLNRVVAVKVLPAGSYDDASRTRFRREAETASALNHPNIVTVYEVGREGEIDFIAMERISGQTLHNVAGGRPIALRKLTQIATQIADALAAAHEAGIVHRDLKPSNVMVNDRGIVKVLDFGLAKVVAAGPANGRDLSLAGQIAGTAYYMSPEQAEGKPVDARSDIFTFGSVLYELLTGTRPFQRETLHETLTAISTAEPEPLRRLRPDIPAVLERIVEKCTRKQPFERWQSLSDVKLILQDLALDLDSGAGRESRRGTGEPRPNGRKWLWYGMAGAAVAFTAGLAGGVRLGRPPASPAVAAVRLVTADKGLSTAPALSRDGSLLAFSSDRPNHNLDIFLQQVGGGEPLRLTSDVADETDPAFSPDAARLAFRSEKDGGGIYIIPALGGDAVLIAPKGRNPRFSPNGKSVAFWEGREGSLEPGSSKAYLVDFAGGAPRAIETGLAWARYPVWSPDGNSLLVYGRRAVAPGAASEEDWWTVPAAGGQARSLRVRDAVRPLRVRRFPAVLDWYLGEDGPEVLFAPDGGDTSNLWRMSAQAGGQPIGRPVRLTHGPGRHVRASVAKTAEGTMRLAYVDETLNLDVWQQPVNGRTGLADGPLRQLTNRLTPEMNPSLSGDGKVAYFITERLGVWTLTRKDLGSERERILYSSPQFLYNARVASAGSKVFFSALGSDLMAIPTAGGAIEKLCVKCGAVTGVAPQGDRVLFEPVHDEHLMMFDVKSGKTIKLADRGDDHTLIDSGQFSPDGRWVAFHAMNNQTRESVVYAIPVSGALPVPKDQWIPITRSADLGRDPAWAPSGAPFVYFTAEKDGFRCLWSQRLHPETRQPQGDPFPVSHFHSSRLALRGPSSSGNIISLGGGGNQLVFTLTETTGNIWMEETMRVQ
ncbi:MAG TPA: protein kinase [Bryobacteraceae bacterium]|nr:protein kinase [Bryobacteraceae bacterium]